MGSTKFDITCNLTVEFKGLKIMGMHQILHLFATSQFSNYSLVCSVHA